jgi:hypothetical protein
LGCLEDIGERGQDLLTVVETEAGCSSGVPLRWPFGHHQKWDLGD